VTVIQEKWDRKVVIDKKEYNNEAVDKKKTVVRRKVEEMKMERTHVVFLVEISHFLCLLL
jgi:hypothetical protein